MNDEEFMRLPRDGRKFDLVNGALEEKATSHLHGILAANLIGHLYPHAKGRGYCGGGLAGFRMPPSENIRCPDFTYMSKARIPGGVPGADFGSCAPDICIELIFRTELGPQMDHALRDYFASGTRYVWLMIPEDRQIIVFTSPVECTTLQAGDTIDADDLLPGFRARVGDLFELE